MNADPCRARSIFLRAVEERRPEGWEAYLDETCGSNAALRERVEVLLKAHAESNSLLDAPAGALGATVDRPIAERPGTAIGPYKLLEQIGEGGFGVVFMAEQQQPIKRKVALKVLKPGMDTRQVVARFEAERQALALMDHANIAQVFDGGTTDAGRPYFVMELVRGVTITEFCDQNSLAIGQRLELFVDVCQAVQHAHQKGIIHRDIKPSNVMVTLHDGQPVVKVIDFGIAKALERQLTEKTLFTSFAQMIGTPLYMSPEQAEQGGLDIDTRSDIYSLGVLLYELLTGTTPFDQQRLRAAGYDEMRRIVREEEPPKPSTRISTLGQAATTVSTQRKSDPRQLSRLLHGELDWIVMKSLEKDRNRRYETANSLALDVERYLKDEPVSACPPSAAYRLRKFARRNKRGLATAALLGVMLLAVVAVLGWAVRDRTVREQKAALDRQTRRTLIEQRVTLALEEASNRHQEGRWKEALDAAKRAEALAASGDSDGETRRRARQVLDDMQMLARLENVRVRSKGVELTEECTGNAQAFREYGIDIDALGRDDAVLRIRTRPIRHELAVLLDSWSHVRRKLAEQGVKPPKDWKELLEIARAADPDPWRDRFRDAVLNDDRQSLIELAASAPLSSLRAETVDRLGDALLAMGAIEEAAAFLKEGQRLHPQDYWINTNLGHCLEQLDPPQLDGAIRHFTAALALHPEAAQAHHRLGLALAAKGDLDAAIAQFRAGLRLSDDVAPLRASLNGALKAKSERNAGLAVRRGAEEMTQVAYRGPLALGPIDTQAHIALGQIHARKAQWKEAAASFTRAIELDPNDDWTSYKLGFVLAELGDLPAYQEYCNTMLSRWGNVTDPQPVIRMAIALRLLAGGVADAAEIAPLVRAALSVGENNKLYPWSLFAKGLHDYRCGRFTEARTACAGSRQRAASSCVALRVADQTIEAMSLYRLGETDEARQMLAAAGRLLDEQGPKFHRGDLGEIWPDCLRCRILRREAEALLNATATETGRSE